MEKLIRRPSSSNLRLSPPSSASAMAAILLVLFVSVPSFANAVKSDSFTPQDSFLLDCGATASTTLPGQRVFLGDQDTSKYLAYEGRDIKAGLALDPAPLFPAPDVLIGDVGSQLFPKGEYHGLGNNAYQTVYRLNMGGNAVTPQNDTLGRTWEPDHSYIDPSVAASNASVSPNIITYPEGESPLIAPPVVYATATQMADASVQVPNFNVSWRMNIDSSFTYLVRLHFADIVSKSVNDLYFNVYINGKPAITGLDLTTVAGGLTAAYYADFVMNSSMVDNANPMTVQVGPMNENTGTRNALLNGLEVFRMNNSVGSLDGEYGVDGKFG
ncbi:putative receptor-like protein kinase [Abeliophyllum distichum]|uniref:Receptor-like protein kinase n=1 Tax=Abeliophyllum distichum TaxID=126358 RepID=A0ABD1PBU3_9LAMI